MTAYSQNGYEALPSTSPKLHTWTLPLAGDDLRLTVRQGSVGFLLCHFAMWFNDHIEALVGGTVDDWGYAYREVRGSETDLSNHASGTAVDLNATGHPLGREGTFPAASALAMHERLAHTYGGCIRWGGDYQHRKDEMHFEINATLSIAEAKARALLDSPRGAALLAANPTQRAVILS